MERNLWHLTQQINFSDEALGIIVKNTGKLFAYKGDFDEHFLRHAALKINANKQQTKNKTVVYLNKKYVKMNNEL